MKQQVKIRLDPELVAAARRFNTGVAEFNRTMVTTFSPVVASFAVGMRNLDAAIKKAQAEQRRQALEQSHRAAAMREFGRRKGRLK